MDQNGVAVGRLSATEAITDSSGKARVRYLPPPPESLGWGRNVPVTVAMSSPLGFSKIRITLMTPKAPASAAPQAPPQTEPRRTVRVPYFKDGGLAGWLNVPVGPHGKPQAKTAPPPPPATRPAPPPTTEFLPAAPPPTQARPQAPAGDGWQLAGQAGSDLDGAAQHAGGETSGGQTDDRWDWGEAMPWVPAAAGAAAGGAAALGALLSMVASGVRPREVWDAARELLTQTPAAEPEPPFPPEAEAPPPPEPEPPPPPEPEPEYEPYPEYEPPGSHRNGERNQYGEVWSDEYGAWLNPRVLEEDAKHRRIWDQARNINRASGMGQYQEYQDMLDAKRLVDDQVGENLVRAKWEQTDRLNRILDDMAEMEITEAGGMDQGRAEFISQMRERIARLEASDDHLGAWRDSWDLANVLSRQYKTGYVPNYTYADAIRDSAMQQAAALLDMTVTGGWANVALSGGTSYYHSVSSGDSSAVATVKGLGSGLMTWGVGQVGGRYGVGAGAAASGALAMGQSLYQGEDLWTATKNGFSAGATDYGVGKLTHFVQTAGGRAGQGAAGAGDVAEAGMRLRGRVRRPQGMEAELLAGKARQGERPVVDETGPAPKASDQPPDQARRAPRPDVDEAGLAPKAPDQAPGKGRDEAPPVPPPPPEPGKARPDAVMFDALKPTPGAGEPGASPPPPPPPGGGAEGPPSGPKRDFIKMDLSPEGSLKTDTPSQYQPVEAPAPKNMDARREAFDLANHKGRDTMQNLDKAVKSGDANAIEKSTLEVLTDMRAKSDLNQRAHQAPVREQIKLINETTDRWYQQTDQGVVRHMAQKSGLDPAAIEPHPDRPGVYRDKNTKELLYKVEGATNPRPPEEVKLPRDRDVTYYRLAKEGEMVPDPNQGGKLIKVEKGAEVWVDATTADVKQTYQREFHRVVNASERMPGVSPKRLAQMAEQTPVTHIEAEAYDSRPRALEVLGDKTHGMKFQDSEQVGLTMDHKAREAYARADRLERAGRRAGRQDWLAEAENYRADGHRQTVKQWDKQVLPRLEAAKAKGFEVPPKMQEGMEILRKVDTAGKAPVDAEVELAKLGLTPERLSMEMGKKMEELDKLVPPAGK